MTLHFQTNSSLIFSLEKSTAPNKCQNNYLFEHVSLFDILPLNLWFELAIFPFQNISICRTIIYMTCLICLHADDIRLRASIIFVQANLESYY
jgi:hypothetical protein